MEESIIMNRTELITMSPLVLAYIGDTIYESYIREYLIRKNINKKVNDLHKSAIKYVNAKAQATVMHEIEDELSEDELRIYKRGRNQKSHTSPKNADIIDYKCATGFEALVGYLHLGGEKDRLDYIVEKGINIIEKNM
ncbi:Mini-ribonuclease 3 [Romboutsia hominis]|uniref:Mini-ribonuclease 3 n=2 Tax=Peptostreptococcaceae TaxID=186804 RepID=A0A2P2BVH8_9FIRM|nr:Mini-ribonuclease 3 [Romboutsia hominis]